MLEMSVSDEDFVVGVGCESRGWRHDDSHVLIPRP